MRFGNTAPNPRGRTGRTVSSPAVWLALIAIAAVLLAGCGIPWQVGTASSTVKGKRAQHIGPIRILFTSDVEGTVDPCG